MSNLIQQVFSDKAMSLYAFREAVIKLENKLLDLPDATLRDDPRTPMKHRFAPGLYAREIKIPRGYLLTTGIHKTEHFAIISKGRCIVATENGNQYIEAGDTIHTMIGTKRAILVLEDLIWTTIHAINASNPEDAIEQIEFKTFKECDKFLLEDIH